MTCKNHKSSLQADTAVSVCLCLGKPTLGWLLLLNVPGASLPRALLWPRQAPAVITHPGSLLPRTSAFACLHLGVFMLT